MRLAAIGDLHVREDRASDYREMFIQIGREADALALCGDLTDWGTIKQAEALADDLRHCSVPIIGVLGNHDVECGHEEDVCRILREAGMHLLDGDSVLVGDVAFAGVKGFAGGFGRHMLASFGEDALKAFAHEGVQQAIRLENGLRSARGRAVVAVLHYGPIAETAEGEPLEIYPFLGCSRLAETIDRFDVAAVLHGHAHRGKYAGRTPGGAPVFNVAHSVPKPTGKPYALIDV